MTKPKENIGREDDGNKIRSSNTPRSNQEISLKTRNEVARMRKACRLARSILDDLKASITPGIATQYLEKTCESLVQGTGARLALKGYRSFRNSVCTSVNHVAAHGVPGDYILENGDVITVDVIVENDGWFGDCAWTYSVGNIDVDTRRLLKAAQLCTSAGIDAAKSGCRFGDIGAAIEETARRHGCSVLDNFVGHGIGRTIHQDPMVLNTGEAGVGMPVVPGMVFTIEPILCLGKPEVRTLTDGWSVVTRDSSRCAQFEHTIAIYSDETEVLTG